MRHRATRGHESFSFADLLELPAKATPARSDDGPADVGAHGAQQHMAARMASADAPPRH